jgi:hypothetical protein
MRPIGSREGAGPWRSRAAPAAGLLLALGIAGTALAQSPVAAGEGCAPLARPDGFRPLQEAERRAYDAIEFTVMRDGRPATEVVAGPKCYQVYVAEDGAGGATVPQILARYRERLAEVGADILFADAHRIFARGRAAGRETWFRVNVQAYEIDVTVLARAPLQPSLTRPSGRDHRLLGHMPHYREIAAERHRDAARRFTVPGAGDVREVEVRGAVTEIAYQAQSPAQLNSDVEIQENYRLALRARGADILAADWRTTVARLAERGRIVWVGVTSQVSDISVVVVEVRLPPPAPRLGDAALRRMLDRDGRATLAAGLGFGPAASGQVDRGLVAQVTRLMRRDRVMAARLVVHTDDLGEGDSNRRRSSALAEAYAAAIAKQGIAPDRLAAAGAGPDRPVADNATVEGRAANRRVEIVRIEPAPPPVPPERPDQ